MAVTGTGTQADPFIVHSYSEFMTLSGHAPVDSGWTYIKWFDTPNQVLDCNEYGSEFKWHSFSAYGGNYTAKGIDIDLNGCTIKNLIIADGEAMFNGHWDGANSRKHQLRVHDGSIRNVFLGSATSRFVDGSYVEFSNVSVSASLGSSETEYFINSSENILGTIVFDNCAFYIAAGNLQTGIFNRVVISDTDIELHIDNQNQQNMFPNCSFTDCRFQGKIGGNAIRTGSYPSFFFTVFGLNSNGTQTNDTVLTNCVVDVDISDMTLDWSGAPVHFYAPSNGATLNTNIFCNSHCPAGYNHPSDWNYISHTLMRNGAYLNSKGFTVVEVVEG